MHQQAVLVKVTSICVPLVISCYAVTFFYVSYIKKASNCLFSNWPIHKILTELLEISIILNTDY